MQVQVIFLLIKNARKLLRDITGDILDRGVGDQVQIELRA